MRLALLSLGLLAVAALGAPAASADGFVAVCFYQSGSVDVDADLSHLPDGQVRVQAGNDIVIIKVDGNAGARC